MEAAEAALPSGDPASGPHPHAPSEAHAAANGTNDVAGDKGLTAARKAALRAGVNTRHSAAIGAGEVAEVHALLGSEHIFKCLVV